MNIELACFLFVIFGAVIFLLSNRTIISSLGVMLILGSLFYVATINHFVYAEISLLIHFIIFFLWIMVLLRPYFSNKKITYNESCIKRKTMFWVTLSFAILISCIVVFEHFKEIEFQESMVIKARFVFLSQLAAENGFLIWFVTISTILVFLSSMIFLTINKEVADE